MLTQQQWFELLQRKYVQRADVRQQALGLVYMEAETHDLSRTIAEALRLQTYAQPAWRPIDTAPQDNKRPLYLARLDERGQLLELDFDGAWEYWQESWEMPHINGYGWCSAGGIEEPTHWAYQDEPLPMMQSTAAARDVAAERARQVEEEGWAPEHDDLHRNHEMSTAAGCYAMFTLAFPEGDPPKYWPWAKEWWKPSDHRRNLVKAGALILAEIERLDRAAAPTQQQGS